MARYSIEFTPNVRKDLKKIEKQQIVKLLSAIQRLAEQPSPMEYKKLTNEALYRIRIGDYRVIYEIHDDKLVVVIVKTGHRKSVYED